MQPIKYLFQYSQKQFGDHDRLKGFADLEVYRFIFSLSYKDINLKFHVSYSFCLNSVMLRYNV